MNVGELVARYQQLTQNISDTQEDVRLFTQNVLTDMRSDVVNALSASMLSYLPTSMDTPEPRVFHTPKDISVNEITQQIRNLNARIASLKSSNVPSLPSLKNLLSELTESIDIEAPDVDTLTITKPTITSPEFTASAPDSVDISIPELDLQEASIEHWDFEDLNNYLRSLILLTDALIDEIGNLTPPEIPSVDVEDIEIPLFTYSTEKFDEAVQQYLNSLSNLDNLKIDDVIKRAYKQTEDERQSLVFPTVDYYKYYEEVRKASKKASLRGWSSPDGTQQSEVLNAKLKYIQERVKKETEAELADSTYRIEESLSLIQRYLKIVRTTADFYGASILAYLNITDAKYRFTHAITRAYLDAYSAQLEGFRLKFDEYTIRIKELYRGIEYLLADLRTKELNARADIPNLKSSLLDLSYKSVQLLKFRGDIQREHLKLLTYRNNILIYQLYTSLFREEVRLSSAEIEKFIYDTKNRLFPLLFEGLQYREVTDRLRHNLSLANTGVGLFNKNLSVIRAYLEAFLKSGDYKDIEADLLTLNERLSRLADLSRMETARRDTSSALTRDDFEIQFNMFRDTLKKISADLAQIISQTELNFRKYAEHVTLYDSTYGAYLQDRVAGMLSNIRTAVTITNKIVEG